jgi:hypothetical protein
LNNNEIKVEVNIKKNYRNYRNYTNTWRLSNIFLNDQWVIEEIKEESFKIPIIKWK